MGSAWCLHRERRRPGFERLWVGCAKSIPAHRRPATRAVASTYGSVSATTPRFKPLSATES